MRILYLLAGRRRAGAVLMSAAIGGIRVVVGVTGGAVIVAIIFAMLVECVAVFVAVLAVLRMIGQLAGFMAFAGPEEDESDGRRDDGRVAEE